MMRAGNRPGATKKSLPCAPKTIVNYVGILGAIYHYATHPRRRWAGADPTDDVDLPDLERNTDIRFLDPLECAALADAAAPGPFQRIDRAFYIVAAQTGLRHGELVALRWRDVDWTAMRIRVRRNYVRGEFGTPKTRRSTRAVPMSAEVGAALERLFSSRAFRTTTISSSHPRTTAARFRRPPTGGASARPWPPRDSIQP
jgi:integrase